VTLCPETPADAGFLEALYASTRGDLDGLDAPVRQSILRLQSSAREQQYRGNHPTADASVIVLDGLPIGRLLVNRTAGALVIIDIAILPEYRGAGIGRMQIENLLREAAASGRPVRLRVLETNPAIRLYQRLGFARTGTAGAYVEMTWKGPWTERS